jgi:hypothetical protein
MFAAPAQLFSYPSGDHSVAPKRLLTDRFLRSLPPAKPGQRVEVWDTGVPGFGIRIHDIEDANPARRGRAGRISFMLYARFARGAASTRRTIGTYGLITLQDARRIAGEWRSQVGKGIDPAIVLAAARDKAEREAALRIKHSFANVAETFLADKLKQERSGKVIGVAGRSNILPLGCSCKVLARDSDILCANRWGRSHRHQPKHFHLSPLVLHWRCDGADRIRRGIVALAIRLKGPRSSRPSRKANYPIWVMWKPPVDGRFMRRGWISRLLPEPYAPFA